MGIPTAGHVRISSHSPKWRSLRQTQLFRVLLLMLFGLVALAFSGVARAGTVQHPLQAPAVIFDAPIVADTYVDGASPDTINGTNTILRAGDSGTDTVPDLAVLRWWLCVR